MKRKRYSRKFQRRAVERMETCEDVGELARELGVRPRCLYKWRRKLEMVEPGQEASRPSTHASAHRKEIHRLKQLLAEKTLEVDFLRGALQKIEARRQRRATLARWHLRPDPRSDVIAIALCSFPYFFVRRTKVFPPIIISRAI